MQLYLKPSPFCLGMCQTPLPEMKVSNEHRASFIPSLLPFSLHPSQATRANTLAAFSPHAGFCDSWLKGGSDPPLGVAVSTKRIERTAVPNNGLRLHSVPVIHRGDIKEATEQRAEQSSVVLPVAYQPLWLTHTEQISLNSCIEKEHLPHGVESWALPIWTTELRAIFKHKKSMSWKLWGRRHGTTPFITARLRLPWKSGLSTTPSPSWKIPMRILRNWPTLCPIRRRF